MLTINEISFAIQGESNAGPVTLSLLSETFAPRQTHLRRRESS
jgi:hypothetical protein